MDGGPSAAMAVMPVNTCISCVVWQTRRLVHVGMGVVAVVKDATGGAHDGWLGIGEPVLGLSDLRACYYGL